MLGKAVLAKALRELVEKDVEFFIEKVRQMFDEEERLELAKRVLLEEFGVIAFNVGVEEDPSGCGRVYARYRFSFLSAWEEECRWIFIGENEEGKFYANFMEFRVTEIDPRRFSYEDWRCRRVTDKYYPYMLCYEFSKDIEKYGLVWRLSVIVGVFKPEEVE